MARQELSRHADNPASGCSTPETVAECCKRPPSAAPGTVSDAPSRAPLPLSSSHSHHGCTPLTPGPQGDADRVCHLVDAVLQLLPGRVVEPDVLRIRTCHLARACSRSGSAWPAFRRSTPQDCASLASGQAHLCPDGADSGRPAVAWKVREQWAVVLAGEETAAHQATASRGPDVHAGRSSQRVAPDRPRPPTQLLRLQHGCDQQCLYDVGSLYCSRQTLIMLAGCIPPALEVRAAIFPPDTS